MAKQVNKDMIISEMLQLDEAIAPILMRSGMHCIFSPPMTENTTTPMRTDNSGGAMNL